MSGTASDFPGKYPVLIGTKSFAVDTSYEAFRRQSFHHDTIPSQRESLELTDVPGEGTINTEGLWRRGQVTWHHGAGQLYADRKDSDNARFLNSINVDPWNQDQLTLLPTTTARISDTSGSYNTAKCLTINGSVWILQTWIPGQAGGGKPFVLKYTSDWSSYTTVTISGVTGDINDIASDGNSVFVAGFYSTGQGVWVAGPSGMGWGSFSKIINDSVERIWCCGDRVFAGVGPDLWDITNCSGAAQNLAAGSAVLIMTHPNPNWHWSDMTAGESFVYASGNVLLATENLQQANLGDSAVYAFSTAVGVGGLQPGVSLAGSGALAYKPPFGEQIDTIQAYQNYVFLGGNQGVRCCRSVSLYDPAGSAGDLIAGPLLPNMTAPFQSPFSPYTGATCGGMVGGGRWVWFHWPNFSYGGTTYLGLGRLDLGNFIAELQPAYATDLMVSNGVVSSDVERGCVFWDPVSNGPGFVSIVANGFNIYTADYNVSVPNGYRYCSTGYMRTGLFTYGMQDNKTVAQANLKSASANLYAPFDTAGGTITLDVSYDRGAFASLAPLAPNQQANPPVLVNSLTQAEEIEIETILTSGTSGGHANAARPFLNRWTIKSVPNVVSGVRVFVALQLYKSNEMEGTIDYSGVYDDYAYLENLRLSQAIVTYEEGSGQAGLTNYTATCVVEECYWMPEQLKDDADGGFEGVLVVTLKTIVG
jgi:hypothetical protein